MFVPNDMLFYNNICICCPNKDSMIRMSFDTVKCGSSIARHCTIITEFQNLILNLLNK